MYETLKKKHWIKKHYYKFLSGFYVISQDWWNSQWNAINIIIYDIVYTIIMNFESSIEKIVSNSTLKNKIFPILKTWYIVYNKNHHLKWHLHKLHFWFLMLLRMGIVIKVLSTLLLRNVSISCIGLYYERLLALCLFTYSFGVWNLHTGCQRSWITHSV